MDKWTEVEISHKTVKRSWGGDGLRLIGVHGRVRVDEAGILAKTDNLLAVWVVLGEVVGGATWCEDPL